MPRFGERGELVSKDGSLASQASKGEIELELAEGRNREVRRMFETLGFIVKRLVRTQIGPIKLGQLKSGRWRALTETEIKTLLSR